MYLTNVIGLHKNTALLLTLFLFLNTCLAQTVKKKMLDTSSYKSWPTLYGWHSYKISNCGKYVLYTNRINYGSNKLIIQSLTGKWQKEIDGPFSNALFFANNRTMAYQKGGMLYLQTLGADHAEELQGVTSFKLYNQNGADLLIYKTVDRSLVLYNYKAKKKTSIQGVEDYRMSEDATRLVVKRALKGKLVLQYYDLLGNSMQTVWTGKNVDGLLFNDKTGQVAFIAKDSVKQTIWLYTPKQQKAIPLPCELLVAPGFELDGLERFSTIEGKLFIKMKKIKQATDKRVNPVEVWSYRDVWFRPSEIKHLEYNPSRSYLFVYDFKSNKLIRIENEKERASFTQGIDRYALVVSENGDRGEAYWNTAVRKTCLLDLHTGVRQNLPFGYYRLSITGKFLTVWKKKEGFEGYVECTNLQTGATVNLTKQVDIARCEGEKGRQPAIDPGNLSVYAWIENDAAILAHDLYDIWQLDPEGIKPPVNLTAGMGRKQHIKFRFANGQMKPLKEGNKVVVTAFSDDTKDNGFYSICIGKSEPELLTMGSYLYHAPSEECNYPYGMPPIKAKNANVWLVMRSSATSAPNLFWTKDFKTFNSVSDIYPEKNYLWYTTELIRFKTKNGVTTDAILYKPENFDPTKKYPVLFNYYVKRSDRLNYYMKPGYLSVEEGGYCFNYPMMLSKGYLICQTDINFKPGETASSVVDALEGAADYLSQFSYVDNKKLGAMGGSFGGYSTNCLVAFSNKFAAAVSVSGLSDVLSLYGGQWGGKSSFSEYVENRGYKMGVSPSQDPDRYIKNSPVAYAKNATTPVLMVIHDFDGNAPVEQGIEWFTNLRREGKRAWLLRYKGSGHAINKDDEPDFYIRMNQFFDHYLKGAPAPKWMLYGIPAKDIGYEDGMELVREKDKNGNWLTPGPGLVTEEEQKRIDEYSKTPLKDKLKEWVNDEHQE